MSARHLFPNAQTVIDYQPNALHAKAIYPNLTIEVQYCVRRDEYKVRTTERFLGGRTQVAFIPAAELPAKLLAAKLIEGGA